MVSPRGRDWLRAAGNYLECTVSLGFDEVHLPRERVESQAVEYTLAAVREELGECTRCRLHTTRKSIVFGEGDPHAAIMFVGEGPGADEDRQGRPFVGRAGALLTKMINAMGLDRSQVYIANVVKCRPPGNRDPEAEEIAACLPFLERQIQCVNPQVIVALGRIATGTLLKNRASLTKIRGVLFERNGVKVIPTYHPSFLLRQERERRYKAEAWADLQQVMALVGLGDSPRESRP
ncbi:MAG: uracil-DNA glycosylase [Desulfomonilaceae bacterium]